MQNQNTKQKTVIPTVRYHPSIQTPGDTPRTSPAQKTRAAAVRCPQTGSPQTGSPQTRSPQTGRPQIRRPQTRSPQTGRPQTGSPQTGSPQIRRPQTGSPQTGSPQTGSPQIRRPQTGRPQTGSPQTGRPQTGRPQIRSSQTGRPQTGSPQVDLGPGVRLPPAGGQRQTAQKAIRKLVQRDAADLDPERGPLRPDQVPLRPDQVPLGLEVQVDRGVVEEVEVLTRGQSSNQDWFAWRKNRITASVAHRIAHCRFSNGKSPTPPTSYLTAITGEGRSVQTRAMSWGVQMEAEVVRRYQKMKSAAMAQPVSVRDCGLFIDARRPWLAASPDGIVTDNRTGQWLLCLEVKCPYKHRDRRVEDACRTDPAFCLEIQDEDGREPKESPVYRLKTSHSYFTQIQCQLAVTGLRRADLAVFTLKELAIVPVTFDPDLWEETVSKLEVFYRDAVLPHLRGKTGRDTAAAWMPEL